MSYAMAVRPSTPVDNTRWQQVLDRDRDANFFYSVRSTGVFCRPSCPSRRPSRENVAFFETPGAAQAAGFRACMRCRPTEAVTDRFATPIAKAAAYLASHSEESVTLGDLSLLTGLDSFQLQKNFKRIYGITPKEFALARKLERFRKRLGAATVTDAIYEAGFSSPSRMYESTAAMGMTPTQAKRGAEGMEIQYTTADCSLGKMLVAATALGVCSIAFGDDDHQLEVELRSRFPHATIECSKDDPLLAQGIRFVLAQLRSAPHELDLPLDLRATVFQQRVWKALRGIPRGETRTYAEVAQEIGQPTATRAVARACATNPVALANPCHRVVHTSGKASGYRWGVERKKKILEIEGASASL